MNVVVTGGGGFLGRRITKMLLERGDHVRVFGRHRYPHLESCGATGSIGDIRDADVVTRSFQGADAVVHTAARAGVWGSREAFFEINVHGTANVIHACLLNAVPILVFTSSPSVVIGRRDIVNGTEALPYPRRYLAAYPASKAAAEKMVLDANGGEMGAGSDAEYPSTGTSAKPASRLRTCALRPHLIWGPGDPHLIPRLIQQGRERRLVRVGRGLNRVDLTYVDNAAWAHVQALDELAGAGHAAGKVYFIGDAHPVLLWPWIDELLTGVGLARVTRGIPYPAGHLLGGLLELVHTLIPRLGEPRLTRFVAAQLALSHCFSHARAEADFGYRPLVDAATGMQRLLDWLRRADAATAEPGSSGTENNTEIGPCGTYC